MPKVVIVGLAGKAGTGKTSVAEQFVPAHSPGRQKIGNDIIVTDKLKLAAPLYEIYSALEISGSEAKSRQEYAVFDVLREVFGGNPLYGAPPIPDLYDYTELVLKKATELDTTRPRELLQWTGDMCRATNEDCFVNLLIKKAFLLAEQNAAVVNREVDPTSYEELVVAIVVDDIRFNNEAARLKKVFNKDCVITRLECEESERMDRVIDRDGGAKMSLYRHASEAISIEERYIDNTIDTTMFDPEMVAAMIANDVNNSLRQYIFQPKLGAMNG